MMTRQIWSYEVLGVLCAGVVIAHSAFADPSGGGQASTTIIEKLEVEWFAPTYCSGSGLLENGDLLFVCSQGNSAFSAKGQVSFAISGSQSHAPGTIELRIPEKAFTDRDAAATGKSAVLGVSSADGWATRTDTETGEVVIYNTETKPPAMAYAFEVSYANIYPMDVVDMAESGRFKANAKIMEDGGEAVTAQSNVVKAFADTCASIEKTAKYPIRYYSAWQQSWGEKPVDATDYFYVVYAITARADYPSQSYTITVADTPLNGGEVVGYSSSVTLRNREDTKPSPLKNFTIGETADYHVRECDTYPQYIGSQAFVRYPKSLVADGLVHAFTNRVVSTIVGDDDHLPSVATNFTVFTYTGDNIVDSGDLYKIVKHENNQRLGDTDRLLNGRTVSGIRHLLLALANCYETTLAPGGDPTLVTSYNQRTNTFEIIDDFIRFESAPDRALTAEDYEITMIQFCDNSFSSRGCRLVANDLGQLSFTGGGSTKFAFQEVKIWGKFNTGTWELVGTLERDDAKASGSLWRFIPSMDGVFYGCQTTSLYNETNPQTMRGSHAVASARFSSVTFPRNCTGVRLTAESAGSDIRLGSIYVTYSLKPSEFVKSVVGSGSSTRVRNYDTLVVRNDQGNVIGPYESTYWNYDPQSLLSATAARDIADFGQEVGHSSAYSDLEPVDRGSTVSKKVLSTVQNLDEKRVEVNYALYCYEFVESMPLDSGPVISGVLVPQSSGTFYDLLPLGMEVVPEVTKAFCYCPYNGAYEFCRGNDLDPSKFEVTSTPNWRGTGRTLVTVTIHDVPNNWTRDSYSSTTLKPVKYASGLGVELQAYYTWEAIMDYGSDLVNPMAYKSGNSTIPSGRADDGGVNSNTRVLADIDGDGNPAGTPKNFRYTYVSHAVDTLMSAEAALTMRVRSEKTGVNDWITGVARNNDGTIDLPPGVPYQYRMRTATARDSAKTDIVLYDSIENYVPSSGSEDLGNPQWRGTLVDVDVSQIEKSGFAPVIYYSTVPGLDVETHTNLADTATWTTVAPADLSTVTAIAVDCRLDKKGNPATLEPSHSLVAILNMLAPEGSEECTGLCRQEAHAYNQVYEHSTILGGNGLSSTQLIHNEYTKVGLLPPLVTDADPAEKVYDAIPTNIAIAVSTTLSEGSITNDATITYFYDPSNPQALDDIPPDAIWSGDIAFTNVTHGTNLVWYIVEVPGYNPITNFSYVTIWPREIVVTADDKLKACGDVDPKLTWTVAGGVDAEGRPRGILSGEEDLVNATVSNDVRHVIIREGAGTPEGELPTPEGAPGHPITIGGSDYLGNYHVTYVPGRLSIMNRRIVELWITDHAHPAPGLVHLQFEPTFNVPLTEGLEAWARAVSGNNRFKVYLSHDQRDVETLATKDVEQEMANEATHVAPAKLRVMENPVDEKYGRVWITFRLPPDCTDYSVSKIVILEP